MRTNSYIDTITTSNPLHGNGYYRIVLNRLVNYNWGMQIKEFEYALTYIHTYRICILDIWHIAMLN